MTHIRNTKLLKQFGKHVRDLRTAREMSQETLAYEADVPISQIGRIERGEVNATISTLHALATAFRISLPELMKF